MLRLILMKYKERLRQGTKMLGPNVGQVSTYALYCILQGHAPSLATKKSFDDLEQYTRLVLVTHLRLVPRTLRTADLLNPEIDLTARSYRAQDLASWLSKM